MLWAGAISGDLTLKKTTVMLQAIDLTKRYSPESPDRRTAPSLDALNLSVQPGEIFCLLGQNGAGKTTTINLFLGFIQPTSGRALINGRSISSDTVAARQFMAYIPEVVMLYGNLTALENLDFFSRLAGFTYSQSQLEAYLSRVGLQADAFSRRLGTFSKGMRQKVGIAIAVAKNADVIFMDEPTSGLDPKATNEFTALVKGLGEQGKSVFMATHDLFNAVNVATRLGIMRQGKLVHTLQAADITAADLQTLYLETI